MSLRTDTRTEVFVFLWAAATFGAAVGFFLGYVARWLS